MTTTIEHFAPLTEAAVSAFMSCGSVAAAIKLTARDYGISLTERQITDIMEAAHKRIYS